MKFSIVSKYPVIHEGLISTLKEKYQSITSFNSIEKFCEGLDNTEDGILILTLFKEDLLVLDKILLLKESYPDLKILIIDFNENNDTFFKLSRMNIDGYILGTFCSEDIKYALHKIFSGTKFYDREALYRLVETEPAATLITNKKNISNHLTKRELEILSQLSNGLSNYGISRNLNISENTVKKHISNIFIKINVKDRSQAIIYAYESGLVSKHYSVN